MHSSVCAFLKTLLNVQKFLLALSLSLLPPLPSWHFVVLCSSVQFSWVRFSVQFSSVQFSAASMLAVVIVCLDCGINYCTLQALNCFNVRSIATPPPPRTAFHSEYRSSEPCVWVPFFRWASFAQKLQKCSLGHPDMDTDMDTDRGAYREGAKVGQGEGGVQKVNWHFSYVQLQCELKVVKKQKKTELALKELKQWKLWLSLSLSVSLCPFLSLCAHCAYAWYLYRLKLNTFDGGLVGLLLSAILMFYWICFEMESAQGLSPPWHMG